MGAIFDIITVGSNVVDVFVKTDPEESDLITIRHGRLPQEELVAYPLGTKIIIKQIEFQIGGGGTNTAVSFSRLGLKTGYLGKIGEDENGLKVFKLLKDEDVVFLGTLGKQNGYSVILDSVGEDRTILTYKGCNDELTFKELKKEKLQAKAYYLCSMVGTSLKTLGKVAEHAKKQKALVAFNPSTYLTKQGVKPIQAILARTDVLILNDEEAKELGGFGDLDGLAKRLSALGPKTVVITRGSKGVLALHEKAIYAAAPPKHLTIHETTGAGDAFGSALLAAMLHKKPFTTAVKMAMINAESVIAHYGAKNILLTKEELERRASADKRRVAKKK
ncbi:carbohydrate kinase family protein [Candidatus Woesearchaeota archaeon]|nr:carbohydrate kinase family protein [Candidatus Woesearchaeota archaeon]